MHIFIFHEKSHIGGGNGYIHNLADQIRQKKIVVTMQSNILNKKNLVDLFRKKYTAVILNLYSPRYFFFTAFLALLNIPTIFIIHGFWFLESKSINPNQSGKKTLYYKISQNVMACLAKKIIVVCKYQYNLLKEVFYINTKKVEIINGAADNNDFFPAIEADNKALRSILNLPSSSNILLCVSRIERRKGLDILVRSLVEVIKKKPKTLLLIIFPTGDFNQIDYFTEILNLIKKLNIGKNVHLITGISEKNLNQYYQVADLFVLSSKELENFSLSMVESLKSGCPVVCFKSGGSPEVISQVSGDFIVQGISPISLAKKIVWYLNLPKTEKLNYREKAHLVSSQYTWEKSALKYLSLIKKISRR